DRPLSGIRVLDLTRVLAGPTCARTLAEHGADVLKITAKHLPNLGYQEYDTGHGKLSAHLDLREPAHVETLRGLVREGDVFSQGYRPGTLGARGFSPEALAQLRPGIVVVSLCAFGHVGPWASRRGFDTVIQTVSGITSRQGDVFPGAAPGRSATPSRCGRGAESSARASCRQGALPCADRGAGDDVDSPVRLRRDPYDAVHETHPFLDADQPQATGLRTHGPQVEPDPFVAHRELDAVAVSTEYHPCLGGLRVLGDVV